MEYYCSVGIQCSVGDCSGFFFVGKNTTTTWTRDHVQYKGLPFARTTYEPLHSVLFLNMKHIRVFSADAHSNEILKQDVRHCGSFRARNMTMWWNFTKETKHNSLTVADGRAQKQTVDPPIKVHFRETICLAHTNLHLRFNSNKNKKKSLRRWSHDWIAPLNIKICLICFGRAA